MPANWSISFPAFPGTVTTGQDFAELMANARDALASVVAAIVEDGQALPASFESSPEQGYLARAGYQDPHIVLVPVEAGGRAVRINVTMDEGLVARLDTLAAPRLPLCAAGPGCPPGSGCGGGGVAPEGVPFHQRAVSRARRGSRT
jgi:predicted RNase H-like HicB family nuclease